MRLILLVLASCLLLAACRSNKSSARIYEGDAPSIRYGESHAGGPMSVR
jgi:hypothetical protein